MPYLSATCANFYYTTLTDMQASGRLPPHTANIRQACYKCFEAEANANLRKCSNCYRVAYCGIGKLPIRSVPNMPILGM
ncbi:hypothetical protein BD779DRAFT_778684 [Infundibulicybe gibba]|nr:hypothetical protein BD779DRAFT_778684 [Infundibulicybe gibba]